MTCTLTTSDDDSVPCSGRKCEQFIICCRESAEKIGPGRCRFKRLRSPEENPVSSLTLMWYYFPSATVTVF